jgi:hypothetical protein
MQTAGLSDRELVLWVVTLLFSHDSISETRSTDHLRFSLADSIALIAASVAAPRSFSPTNLINC